MKEKDLSRAAIIAVLAFMLSGCAGTVSSMVRESDKDSAFTFDGNYTYAVDYPASRQTLGPGWFSDCRAEKYSSSLRIVNSEVLWRWNEDLVVTGFVDSRGRFRLEEALEKDIKGRGEALSDGSVTVILQGDVSEDTMKGLLVYGVAQFNNRGCSYPVAYSKN